MIDKETELNMTDWELSEDYYKEREGKQELKLEDFMMGEDEIPSLVSGEETDPLLAQTISDVKNVLSVCQEGKSVPEIALALYLLLEAVELGDISLLQFDGFLGA